MSIDKIAEILGVDEVNLMHGPMGVALYVRVGATWQGTTVDNAALGRGKHRLEAMTKSLVGVADDLNKSLGRSDDLRKTIGGATRAALQADADAEVRRRWLSGATLGQPYDGPQRQVQRVEPAAQPPLPAPSPAGPAVSESMPSRFHAIMAELKDL